MATNRAKERSSSVVVGKERRVRSSDCQSKKSRTAEKGSSGSEKQVPNYLKPTISSRLETHQHSFQHRGDAIPNIDIDRRRSFDRPPSLSASKLSKASPSSSRLHKALVSPGPRQRTLPKRAAAVSAKGSTASNSKPISTRDCGKWPQPVSTLKTSTVKKNSTTTTSGRNKQASANSSTKAPKRNAETRETAILTQNVEDHRQELIKEAPSHDGVAQEVEESVSQETSALVNGEHDDDDNEVKESDHDHQIEADDHDKVIPTVSEEVNTEQDVEVEKEAAASERKAENDEHHEVEENIKQDKEEEINDETIHDPQDIPPTEGESSVEVKEKEEVEEEEAATKNDESTAEPKQEDAASDPATGGKGKKESTMAFAYNDVIEETKNKLMGARKNKVSALVGAFQTVIDYESSSK